MAYSAAEGQNSFLVEAASKLLQNKELSRLEKFKKGRSRKMEQAQR